MTEKATKSKASEVFEAIARLILFVFGLVGISPVFPEIAKLFHFPAPPDPVTAVLMIIIGFVFLMVACQDPDEEPGDSCDANP